MEMLEKTKITEKQIERLENEIDQLNANLSDLGRIGVSIVIRSSDKKKIDECYKEIVSFLKKKKINIIGKI